MGNTLDRISRFKGSIMDALIFWPLFLRRSRYQGGVIGYDVDTMEPIGCDTHLWKKNGLVQVTSHVIMAPQGLGKTFLAFLIIMRSLFYDVGKNEVVRRNGRLLQRRARATVQMHNFKDNDLVRAETAPIIEDWLGCKMIRPGQLCLNFLSRAMGMLFGEAFTLLCNVISFVDNKPLTSDKEDVLKDVLTVLWEWESRGFDELNQLLDEYLKTVIVYQLSLGDKAMLMHPRNRELFEELWGDEAASLLVRIPTKRINARGRAVTAYEEEISHEALNKLLNDRRFLRGSAARYSEELLKRLLHAAWELRESLYTFKQGQYHDLFSGSGEEFARLLEQRGVSIDLENLPDAVRSLIEMVVAGINLSSIAKDENNKPRHPRRLRDIILYDEFSGESGNAVFGEVNYKERKTQRKSGRVTIFNLQRPNDLHSIGEEGSAVARKAQNLFGDIGAVWLGQQPVSEHAKLTELFNPPKFVLLSLPTLAKGHFWLKTPHEPWRLIAVVGTPKEVLSFNTEAAHNRHMQRYLQTGDVMEYRMYLEETTPEPKPDPTQQQAESETQDGLAQEPALV